MQEWNFSMFALIYSREKNLISLKFSLYDFINAQ